MRLVVINAFTDRPFAGNPAAVCLLDGDGWPEQEWMRQVAAEMRLPMTAFARPLPAGAAADWGLRWFMPHLEANLCGHATLATAFVLADEIAVRGLLRFDTRAGVLVARPGERNTIALDFPAAALAEVAAPDGLADALGTRPEAVFTTGALRDVLAVLPDENGVRGLAPDLDAVARLTLRDGRRGLIVTAPPAGPGRGYDFVSRFFSPAEGLPEDAATGSAHTALGPYWSTRLGRPSLTGLQVSARTGWVGTAMQGERVHVSGRCVTVLDGCLSGPAAAGAGRQAGAAPALRSR